MDHENGHMHKDKNRDKKMDAMSRSGSERMRKPSSESAASSVGRNAEPVRDDERQEKC